MRRQQLTQVREACLGLALEEQLLILEMAVVGSSLITGPAGISIFLNNDNPECDCSVSGSMTARILREAIEASGLELSIGNSPQLIADRMTVILKGLIFEWFTKREDPSFDHVGFAEEMYRAVIPSLLK